jgi:hypothetical protein
VTNGQTFDASVEVRPNPGWPSGENQPHDSDDRVLGFHRATCQIHSTTRRLYVVHSACPSQFSSP